MTSFKTIVQTVTDDAALLHQVVHGGPTTVVSTLGGPVPSLAKLVADKSVEFVAGTVVGQATTQAALAATQATIATAAKVASESARDAALVGAGVYATEAIGRAAVADGVAFKVQGVGDVAAYEYRRTDSATSALIGSYPSASAVAPIKTAVVATGWAYAFTDQLLRIVGGITASGVFTFLTARFNELSFKKISDSLVGAFPNQYFRLSGPRYTVAEVRPDGTFAVAKGYSAAHRVVTLEAERMGATLVDSVFGLAGAHSRIIPEVAGIVSYGQSNGTFETSAVLNGYDTVQLSGATFVAMTTPVNSVINGWQDNLKKLLLSENGVGYSYQLVESTRAVTGTAIVNLSRGTTPYNNILADATNAVAAAAAVGKLFKFEAISFAQGEADAAMGYAEYKFYLRALIANLNEDIIAITGQSEPPVFIIWQVRGGICRNQALAQLDVSRESKDVMLAMPSYWLRSLDDTHATGIRGPVLMGAYYGLVMKRKKIDGKAWHPLCPVGTMKRGALLIARFNMPAGGNLVLDTTTISQATNYGFSLKDSAGGALAISSVSLISQCEVKIVAAAAIPDGAVLEYGMISTAIVGGAEFAYRGNLRDSAGDSVTYTYNATTYRMDNWCVAFSQAL